MKNFLFALLAVMLTYAAVEIAYRLYLQHAGDLTYHVANRSLHEYDSLSGFRFVPNIRATTVSFHKGKPVSWDTISIGPYGNLGNGVQSWTDDDFKILAFGDSFTAYPFSYNSWSEYIAAPLSSALGKNVEVMNLGRDGFSLLQMIRLANITLQNTKADLAVIAFIPGDLARARIWRTQVETNGRERGVVSTQPSRVPDMEYATDVLLIEPALNPDWCLRVFGSANSHQSLVEPLHEKFRRLLNENLTNEFGFLTPLLFNRIRHGEPYYSVRKIPRNPPVGFQRFEEDKEFVEDLKGLLGKGVPVVFVLLPGYEDLKAGKILFSEQERSLYESLNSILPTKVYSLLELENVPEISIDSLFLLPYDRHPSKRGAEWYAKGIVKVIRKSGAATTLPD